MRFYESKGGGRWYKNLCVHSLHTWYLNVHTMYSGHFRLSQVHSQYLRITSQVPKNDLLENDEK